MDFALTDEQQLIQSTARDFSDREIWDRARENARKEHFDTELVRKIADQGYLGAIVPREYGGAGLDYVSYGLVVEEIGHADSAMRTVGPMYGIFSTNASRIRRPPCVRNVAKMIRASAAVPPRRNGH